MDHGETHHQQTIHESEMCRNTNWADKYSELKENSSIGNHTIQQRP